MVVKQCGHSFVVGAAGAGAGSFFLKRLIARTIKKDHKGDDEEVNDGLNERAPLATTAFPT